MDGYLSTKNESAQNASENVLSPIKGTGEVTVEETAEDSLVSATDVEENENAKDIERSDVESESG